MLAQLMQPFQDERGAENKTASKKKVKHFFTYLGVYYLVSVSPSGPMPGILASPRQGRGQIKSREGG